MNITTHHTEGGGIIDDFAFFARFLEEGGLEEGGETFPGFTGTLRQ